MSKWERWPWRKLYLTEQGSFGLLPLMVRGVAAELLKICDDDGVIECGSSSLAVVVSRRLGAHDKEKRALRGMLDALIKDGYLAPSGSTAWQIVNFRVAQRPRRGGDGEGQRSSAEHQDDASTTPARRQQDVSTTPARPVHDVSRTSAGRQHDASTTSAGRQQDTKNDLSARNHSGSRRKNDAASHARARSEIRVEEIRKEGEGGAGGASPPPGPLRSPPARPPSSFGLTTEKVDGPADLGQAFADGIAKATGSICTAPGKRWDREALKRIAAAKADNSGGDIPAWIADRANAFARWTLEEETDPRKKRLDVETFERWLNEGQREPIPPHEDPPLDNYPPPRWNKVSEKEGAPAPAAESLDADTLARVEATRAEQLAKLQALLATEELKA